MTRLIARLPILAAIAFCFAALAPAASAGTYGDRLVGEGDEFFRAGNFFRASESYRCAVLEEPADGEKKLSFGHSLFALGNYAYAAYSFRRGVRYLGYPDDLKVEVVGLFPSRLSFDRSIRDVRRYASYYPSDPHALTVIAYVSYFASERGEAEAACRRLLGLDPRDGFAQYLLRRIEGEGGSGMVPAPTPAHPERILASGAGRPPAAIVPASQTGGPGSLGPKLAATEPAVVLKRPPAGPPPLELPQGERSGAALSPSRDDVEPAISR